MIDHTNNSRQREMQIGLKWKYKIHKPPPGQPSSHGFCFKSPQLGQARVRTVHRCQPSEMTNTNTNTPMPTIWDDIGVSKIQRQRQRQRHRCQPSEITSVFQTFSTGSVSYMWSRHCRAESRPAGSTTNKERTWIWYFLLSVYSYCWACQTLHDSWFFFSGGPRKFSI